VVKQNFFHACYITKCPLLKRRVVKNHKLHGDDVASACAQPQRSMKFYVTEIIHIRFETRCFDNCASCGPWPIDSWSFLSASFEVEVFDCGSIAVTADDLSRQVERYFRRVWQRPRRRQTLVRSIRFKTFAVFTNSSIDFGKFVFCLKCGLLVIWTFVYF